MFELWRILQALGCEYICAQLPVRLLYHQEFIPAPHIKHLTHAPGFQYEVHKHGTSDPYPCIRSYQPWRWLLLGVRNPAKAGIRRALWRYRPFSDFGVVHRNSFLWAGSGGVGSYSSSCVLSCLICDQYPVYAVVTEQNMSYADGPCHPSNF